MFGIIAAFIMLIAVINYTNMTTAGSMKRAREIVWLVLIAFLISAPLSWLAMNTWLSGFAYRIGIGTILAAGAVSLLCALGTVSFQAFKAARLDPVKSLRYE